MALDVAVDAIGHDRLLALWPVRLVPQTRDWLSANVQEGTLSNLRTAVAGTRGRAPGVADL